MRNKIAFILVMLGMIFLFLTPLKQAVLGAKLTYVNYTYVSSDTVNFTELDTIELKQPTFKELLKIKKKTQYMGMIDIPSANINQHVSPTVDDQSLFTGVANMFPNRNADSENIVLLGHHLYDESYFFGKLGELSEGDDIYLSLNNKDYHYSVTESYIVDEKSVSVMNNTSYGELTLITCDKPTYTNKRLIVKAELKAFPKQDKHDNIGDHKTNDEANSDILKQVIQYLKLIGLIILMVFCIFLAYRIMEKIGANDNE